MSRKALFILSRPHIILLILFASTLTIHLMRAENITDHLANIAQHLLPEPIYKFSLTITFDPDGDVEVSTYLPLENSRQENLDETIVAKGLEIDETRSLNGRHIKWRGNSQNQLISYTALLSLQGVQYIISPDIEIPEQYDNEYLSYLQKTDVIPIFHEEIIQLWDKIKPVNENNLYQVLNAIYSHTYNQIETLPFKGLTDSLTALRLNAASCNGKSRLFLSLARLNNIPSRLVGGVILDGKRKKTSHQWVEIYIQGHWVPFDITNGHFAKLPENYLELYRGDHYLFNHTSDINFNYYFSSSRENIAPAVYRDIEINNKLIPNASKLLQDLGLPLKASIIFLLFPLCTLIISFQRNIVGLKTFGTFMPMLIAATCIYTGFLYGLISFIIVLLLAVAGHIILGKFNILKIPRLASIITLISIAVLYGIVFIDIPLGVELGILTLFPVIIISFTADRIHEMTNESNWRAIAHGGIGSLLSITLCYMSFNSILLQGLLSLYPEFLFLVLAALLYIGSWSGMRIFETIRFWTLIGRTDSSVLTMNDRNRNFINKYNDKNLLKLAIDKIKSKEALEAENIPCPPTLSICRTPVEMDAFLKKVENVQEFVVKPNKGFGGNGILILSRPDDKDGFITKSGHLYSVTALKKHIGEILYGHFSQDGEEDYAFIEPLIKQHHSLTAISPLGLCDIRIIVCNGRLISSMLRVPTSRSDGKANLHQGAIGVSININTGKIERAVLNGHEITHHPDIDVAFKEIKIPFWDDIKNIAQQCYIAIPLGFMGVDICIDEEHGPLVLEVNGRPGLEIQNVQDAGMRIPAHEAYKYV